MSNFTSYADSAQNNVPLAAAPSSTSTATNTPPSTNQNDNGGKKKKSAKRRKVNHACLYCRRSHMTCDDGRPCQRCIKREIGHLCHDERRQKSTDKPPANTTGEMSRSFAPVPVYQGPPQNQQPPQQSAWPVNVIPGQILYQPETLGNEFSVLTDFLETLDEGTFFTPPSSNLTPSLLPSASYSSQNISAVQPSFVSDPLSIDITPGATQHQQQKQQDDTSSIILPAATKAEKFLLTAADQESGSRNERLNRVIRSKYEAGLLKPYNYVKGYARLSRWMDRNVSQESKQQILQPLSVLRPKFRAVAQSLRDLDLVFIEEAFERLLLDYDRVFSAMGVPACLWRRTGEIYKGNREFSELVGVDGYMMRDGRLCIYELMAEESAVNYWEKYGHVAFDSSQKAVLTSCVLRYKPALNTGSSSPNSSKAKRSEELQNEEGFINCCFSFTIRRDKWGIPTMIVGNFIKC